MYNFFFLFFKNRCAYDLYRRRDKNTPRSCPACNKILASRVHLCDDGDGGAAVPIAAAHITDPVININSTNSQLNGSIPRPVYRSNLSLASLSLRASSLTINSECHATSSV